MIRHFALVFAAGLLGLLPVVDHRRIPPTFFRQIVAIALPALLLAIALDLRGGRAVLAPAIGLGVATFVYLGCILRGRISAARILVWCLTGLAIAALAVEARGEGRGFLAAATAAGLLGSVMLAMLLGHAYLNIPGLPIVHLRRLGWLFGAFLGARLITVGLAAAQLLGGPAGAQRARPLDAEAILASDLPFLALRLAMGVVVPGVLAVMVDRTARIRSTQSATGLLYVALVFVLFGELIASYLWAAAGLPAEARMAMEIEFRCPQCQAVGHTGWELGGGLACPHCHHVLAAAAGGPATADPPRLERCPVCNGYEFYRQRDFNRRLGVALVILGVLLAWPTRGISLLVVALIDLGLYALLPRITICYRCEAIFRGLPAGAGGGDFELSTADKYRRIRAEEAADAVEKRQRELGR